VIERVRGRERAREKGKDLSLRERSEKRK